MDTKKRIISMLLSLVMILQIILPVPAMAATNELSSKKASNVETEKEIVPESTNQSEVRFDITDLVEEARENDIQSFSKVKKTRSYKTMADGLSFGDEIMSPAVGAGPSIDMPITVDVKATGLNGKAFDWADLAPDGLNFRIEINGQSVSSDKNGQDLKITNSNDPLNFTINAPQPESTTHLIVYAAENIGIRLFQYKSTGTGTGGGLKFTLELFELPNPNININYVDIYGNKLASVNLPSTNTAKVTTNIKYENADEDFVDLEFVLPTSDQTVNVRGLDGIEIDRTEFNKLTSLEIKLDGKTSGDLTVGDKKYSYTVVTDANMKNPTQITLKYDADVAVPPMKDDKTGPVDPPKGYTRITFDPTSAAKDQTKTYYDVKNTLKWDQARNATPLAVVEPTSPTPTDVTKNFVAWKDNDGKGQKLSEKTGTVAQTTFTAVFEKDIVGPKDPTKPDGKNPDANKYWAVTFESADTTKGTVAAENTVYVLKTANKTLADIAKKAPATTPVGNNKFDGWNPALDANTAINKDLTVKAQFSALDEIVGPKDPTKPDGKNPDANKYWAVTFESADTTKGTVAAENTVYVLKTANKTLADIAKKAPATTPVGNNKFDGWNPALDANTAINKDLTVTGTFTKLTGTNDSDKYDPKGKEITVNVGGTPNAEDGISNKGDLPSGTNYKFKNPVDTSTQGTKDATIIVTYPDQTTDTVNVKVIVKDKTTPTPEGPSVTYPETSIDKGDTKTITPDIKDKDGNPTTTNDIPEVVQPGNGVVVTPHTGGKITVTIPEDYDGPSTIVIPVEVTIGGEKVKTNLIIRVNDDKPVIDYDIPELKIHEYTPTYPVYTSIEKKVVEVKDKEVINSHDQYIFGYPDDTIRPDGDMTRAEAIAVVARLQKLDLSDKSSKIYKDTKADMWYNGAINAAFREGYLLEKEGENIRPNDKITRAELAELISHIDKKNNSLAPFDDVKGHKFEAAINQAYGNERIKGYPDGTFKPDNFITRAEVATMLNKLYDRYPDKNFIDANQNLVHNYKDMSYKGHWGYYELVEAYHSHTYLRLKDNMEEWKVIIK